MKMQIRLYTVILSLLAMPLVGAPVPNESTSPSHRSLFRRWYGDVGRVVPLPPDPWSSPEHRPITVTFGDEVKNPTGFIHRVTTDLAIGDPAIREGLWAISPNSDILQHLHKMKLVLFQGREKKHDTWDTWVIIREPKGSFLTAILDSLTRMPKNSGSKPKNVLDYLFLSGNSVKIRKPKRPQDLERSYPIQSREELKEIALTKAGEERLSVAQKFGLLQTSKYYKNPREEAVEGQYLFKAKSGSIDSAQLVDWNAMIRIDFTKLTDEEKKEIREFRDKHIKRIWELDEGGSP